jgi:hypothetical protein
MVTVEYHGRDGNNFFQYAFTRLLCEQTGMHFGTSWPHTKYFEATPCKPGLIVEGDPLQIRDGTADENGFNRLKRDIAGKRVNLFGFFQEIYPYNLNKETIKGFWKLPTINKNMNDVVIHVRLGDYFHNMVRSVIDPNWYKRCLSLMKFNKKKQKLYIVVEPYSGSKQYLAHFRSYQPTIVSSSAEHDFEFIRSFDKIVCSNSTFSWWATFLSDARTIYTFARWARPWKFNLAHITGAKPIMGHFYQNSRYENLNWHEYWKTKEMQCL